MTFKAWLLFLVMELALSLSPGPAVFYVVSQGLRGGVRAMPATLGILSANAAYFALSATSVGAIMAAGDWFFTAAKWLGAGYLTYLGIHSLRSAMAGPAVPLDRGPRHSPGAPGKIYAGALSLQLSNPKALLFFLALLPQFVDAQRPVVPQMLILAATSMLPEFCILLGYGWLAHHAAKASAIFGATGTLHRWLGWVEGIGLLGCATLVLRFSR